MIDPRIDFYLDGDWLDKAADVRQNPPIKITGGAKDEASVASPSRCTFTMNNPSGDYDPRNPLGQYFGQIGKNTPIRVRVPLLEDNVSQTDSDGWGTNWDNGPSSGGTVADTDWTRAGTVNTHSVPAANAYRRSLLKVENQYWDSCLRATLELPTDDVDGGAVWSEIEFRYLDSSNYVAAQFIFNTDQTVSVQVIDVISGSARILLGATTIDGLDLLADQSFEVAALVEGQVVRTKIWATGDPEPIDWQTTCTRASVRYGRTGIVTTIASGNTNTKPFAITYDNVAVEARPFVGEATGYKPGVSDQSHAAPYVHVTASGITQRTQQGSEPLKSAMLRWWSSDQRWIREGAAAEVRTDPINDTNTLRATDADAADVAVGDFFRIYRPSLGVIENSGQSFIRAVEDQLFTITSKSSSGGFTDINFTPDLLASIQNGDTLASLSEATAADAPVAYWPCEDKRGAGSIASGLVGGTPIVPKFGIPKYAELDTFPGSGPLLKLNNAELASAIPDYTDNGAFTFHTLFHYPKDEEAALNQAIAQLYTTGTAEVWSLLFFLGGGGGLEMNVRAFSTTSGSELFSHFYPIDGFRDAPTMFVFSAEQTSPTEVEYQVEFVEYGADGGASILSYLAAVATGVTDLGKITRMQINPGGGYVETAVGHIAVVGNKMTHFNLRDAPGGHVGEAPVRRLLRLGFEEGVPVTYCQGPYSSSYMGPQQEETLLKNWQHVAEFDMGRFYESRGAYSFEYRALSSMCGQSHFLDVDYAQGGVLEIDADDDDQQTRNDITVNQLNGSSYRAVDETSPISVLPPGEGGVGRYTSAPDVSTLNPSQLPDLAHWRLAIGTVDEERYPAIQFMPSGQVTLAQMFSCGVGNRFRVTNLDARNRYEPIDQLVSGYTLTLHRYVPTLAINGTPSSRYNILILDDDTYGRLDAEDSWLDGGENSTSTNVTVTTDSTRKLWTTDPSQFPLDTMIGGERMTVTSIGAGTPLIQNFVSTRSVNGVVKSHATQTPVVLADSVYLGVA